MKALILIEYGMDFKPNILKLKRELYNKKIPYDVKYSTTLVNPKKYDFIINKSGITLSKTYKNLMEVSNKVFNKPDVNLLCKDKWKTYKALENIVAQPLTSLDYHDIGFPCVVKGRYGSLGKQVFYAKNEEKLKEILDRYFKGIKRKEAMFQQFIPSNRTSYRVMVVGNQIVGCTKLVGKEGTFKSNAHLGGKGEKAMPTAEMIEMVLKCQSKLKADWVGYDLLVDRNTNIVYLCEANGNAFTVTFDKVNNTNCSEIYLDYILSKIPQKEDE